MKALSVTVAAASALLSTAAGPLRARADSSAARDATIGAGAADLRPSLRAAPGWRGASGLHAGDTGLARADAARPAPRIEPPDWALIATPLFGHLRNTTTFRVKMPAKGDFTERLITLSGTGYGGGLLLSGFYRRVSLTHIFYYFPDVTSTVMTGNIVLLGTTLPTGTWIEPSFGLGLAYITTRSTLRDFTYDMEDQLSDGSPTVAYAHFEQFHVRTRNVMPLPEVGLRLRIPVHDWYVRPYYQYLYERLSASARTETGQVDVYRQDNGFRAFAIPLSFDKDSVTEYRSHVLGTAFGLDFHQFLRLNGAIYYNASHALLSSRIIGSALFSRHVGLSAYFEYQDMIQVDNLSIMLGLSFLQMPSRFWRSVTALREARR
jgi:hypothetical protein